MNIDGLEELADEEQYMLDEQDRAGNKRVVRDDWQENERLRHALRAAKKRR